VIPLSFFQGNLFIEWKKNIGTNDTRVWVRSEKWWALSVEDGVLIRKLLFEIGVLDLKVVLLGLIIILFGSFKYKLLLLLLVSQSLEPMDYQWVLCSY